VREAISTSSATNEAGSCAKSTRNSVVVRRPRPDGGRTRNLARK
jgi:hypothetical protein